MTDEFVGAVPSTERPPRDVSLQRAIDLAREHAARTEPEHVPVGSAAGRRLAAAVTARADLPSEDASAMDGCAVRAADTLGALALPARALRGLPWPHLRRGEAAACALGTHPAATCSSTFALIETTPPAEVDVHVGSQTRTPIRDVRGDRSLVGRSRGGFGEAPLPGGPGRPASAAARARSHRAPVSSGPARSRRTSAR
jgi:MoeA N-terminal region (domain I and II)